MDWITDNKLPLGKWIKSGVDVLMDHGAWVFDAFSDGLQFLIEGFVDLMLWFPSLLLVAILAGLAFLLHRSWKLAAMIVSPWFW